MGFTDAAANAYAYQKNGGNNQKSANTSPQLLYSLNKSHGFASTMTVQQCTQIPRLLPSMGIPSAEEMRKNMTSFLEPSVKPPPPQSPSGKIPGNILMFDGVALESKCHYFCREHSKNVDLKITSFKAIEKICVALFEETEPDKKVCFGSDATVVAMAPYARSDHYRPVPLVVSPSDKTEKGEWMALWIQTLIDEYNIHIYGKTMHGPFFTIGSDGNTSFRKARHILCMTDEIDPNSELGRIICSVEHPLVGMNIFTSHKGITGTCDPKHVFERKNVLVDLPTSKPQ
ncbi:hypothetical protein B0H34DRAFT_785029 [Crassisporium funariophilum]|nr:hypothetical protein B0H34DRAFT_785029 [Crassisporium funariophilum]